MSTSHPLDSVVFISLPANFTPPENAFPIDTSIPLPVQMTSSDQLNGAQEFDISGLTWEMILAGILTLLAYEPDTANSGYYRALINAVKPSIKQELTQTAVMCAKNGDFAIAEEIFTALRGLDPEDMATLLNSAIFYDQRADSYRESGLIEDADACDDTAASFYKTVMTAEPSVAESFFNGGFFYLKQKNFARARECFTTYLRIAEDDSENGEYKRQRSQEIIADIDNRNLDDELFKSAYDFIAMGEEERGLEQIKLFLQKNPKVWNAWFLLGWGLRRLGRWEAARDAFLQTIAEGGENADTLNELSICCLETGDLGESKKRLLKALSLEPENTKI
ncbi:MAG: tetratricopeptide repeat protein, partial [Spirochaetaceae bacterium]|nr:tetratricopeptide repeat protein [Spirochaetaceae bacterium]